MIKNRENIPGFRLLLFRRRTLATRRIWKFVHQKNRWRTPRPFESCIGPFMSRIPQPLFDTFECFHELNFLQLNNERPVVQQYLNSFDDNGRAVDSFLVVRSFLKVPGSKSLNFRTSKI